MRKENLTFSRKGEEEMNLYGAAIRDILTRTTDAFVNNDQALAHTVEPLEEVIDELNKDVKKHHMKRLRKGKCSMELGLLLSDLAMRELWKRGEQWQPFILWKMTSTSVRLSAMR